MLTNLKKNAKKETRYNNISNLEIGILINVPIFVKSVKFAKPVGEKIKLSHVQQKWDMIDFTITRVFFTYFPCLFLAKSSKMVKCYAGLESPYRLEIGKSKGK